MSIPGGVVGDDGSNALRAAFRMSDVEPVARASSTLAGMPSGGASTMRTVDQCVARVSPVEMFRVAADVAGWPALLPHYRYVRVRQVAGATARVEMSANRPFGPLDWPTWWVSVMEIQDVPGGAAPAIRFHHIEGITRGMDVEWSFERSADGLGTHVTVLHVWKGPSWPIIGGLAARRIIGPVFVHGIASRTVTGLARAAERRQTSG
jgi:hypothetical protein